MHSLNAFLTHTLITLKCIDLKTSPLLEISFRIFIQLSFNVSSQNKTRFKPDFVRLERLKTEYVWLEWS